jgi:hypothetical protein
MWKTIHKQQPGNTSAISGLATAEEDLRLAKGTIEAGRTHTERLQSAVSRQAQALKENIRLVAEHTSLVTQLDDSAMRLAASQAQLQEAEATVLSLQVEAAGPQPSTAIPPHLMADTFFTVWNHTAAHFGWRVPDPATFNLVAQHFFSQMTNTAIPPAVPQALAQVALGHGMA